MLLTVASLLVGLSQCNSETIIAGSLPQQCLTSGSAACADSFPLVNGASFNCTAELLEQQNMLSRYCVDTVSSATVVAECAQLFPCGTCLPHIQCPVETCTVQFDGVSSLTCTELQTEAEFGCCYQEAVAGMFWSSEVAVSSSFACHNCRFFELPQELRVGEQWVCAGFCIRPTWSLVIKALLKAFVLWISISVACLFAAVLRRSAVRGHLMEVYRQKGLGNSVIRIQDWLKGSHLFMFIVGGGALILSWGIYFNRAIHYQTPLIGVVFEILYGVFLGIDMLVELSVAALLGIGSASRAVITTAVLDCLLITSPWSLTTVEDYRNLKTWFSFAFLGALKASAIWKRWYGAHGNPSSVNQVNLGLFLNLTGYLTAVASMLHVAELIQGSDPLEEAGADNDYRWNLVDALYLFLITVGSLGFGSLYPRTGLGRLTLLLWTVYSLTSIVRVGLSILKALSKNPLRDRHYDPRKDKEYGGRHVLITGDPDSKFVIDALQELFHPEHVHVEALTVVCLLPRPDHLLQVWLKRRENAHLRGRVTVLEGDALNIRDLARVAAAESRAVIIFPRTGDVDPVEEDLNSISRYMNVRRYAWHVSVVLGLYHEDYRNMLDYSVMNGTLEKLNIISLDKFKLSLFAKGCTIPSFVSVMCNLCKSVQVEEEDISQMEAAEALAQGRRKERWVIEYDQGVGMEIYEMPMSKIYVGRRFPEVAEDIFLRSTPSTVILVGIVEYDMAGNRRLNRRVLINPGKLHVISKDKQVYGIFIAGSSSEIKQSYAENNIAGIGGLSESTSTRTSAGELQTQASGSKKERKMTQREAVVTKAALMKPLESDNEDEFRVPVWDKKTGDKVRSRRENVIEQGRETGTLHLVLNLVRMSRMTASLGATVCGFPDEARIWDIIGRDDTEILALPGTAAGSAAALGASKVRGTTDFTMKRSTISRLTTLQEEADAHQARLRASNRRLDLLDMVIKRGGHYLVIVLGMKSAADMTGLRHFVSPVRSGFLGTAEDRPIVVLAPFKPSDWDAVGEFDLLARSDEALAEMTNPKDFARGVFFVQGSPAEEVSLELAGVRRADAVVVHALSGQTDADTVTLAKRVEGMVKNGNVPVMIELGNEAQMDYVSKKRKRDKDDTRKIVSSDATHCPRFVMGQLYFQSIVHTVCAGLLFNSSLQLVLDSLTAAKFQLVPVTTDWDFREYMKLHLDLLRRQDLVPVALLRTQVAEIRKKKNFFIEDLDNLTKATRAVTDFFDINKNSSLRQAVENLRKFVGLKPMDKKIPLWDKPEKYTVTGPNQELVLRDGDVILCISSLATN